MHAINVQLTDKLLRFIKYLLSYLMIDFSKRRLSLMRNQHSWEAHWKKVVSCFLSASLYAQFNSIFWLEALQNYFYLISIRPGFGSQECRNKYFNLCRIFLYFIVMNEPLQSVSLSAFSELLLKVLEAHS